MLVSLHRRQARALLYRLAVEKQPVARDTLLLLLWPDTAESTARRNLTRLLSTLRHDLPDPTILQTTNNTITLNPDLSGSDVLTFAELAHSADMALWEEAVTLYRGPFLSGFSLSNSREFDAWQSQQQYAFERRFLAALNKLIAAKQQAGQIVKAISYAQRYLATDDLSENIHRQLITLYAQSGDRTAALRQYERCVVVLERELGVEPLPETRTAYTAVRDGLPLPPTPTSPRLQWSTLPGLDLPLVGREAVWQELAQVYGRYRNGGVILISGPAGVGKSRLMQTFATAQSALILTGNSHAEGKTLPYQPLVQALRQALPLHTRWRHAAPIWLAEAARLLPELTSHFSSLPQPLEVEAQQAQARLFEAVSQLLRSLATDSPLLLCLDDVHWADEATLGWLQYMARQLSGSNICILATYRINEQTALREWQRTLNRVQLVTDIQLAGLSVTAVAELLRSSGNGLAAPQTLATRIHTATGGNTYFVLETIRELLVTGQLANPPTTLPLPTTVRDAVLRRVARLTPLTQQILAITAVLAPILTFATIQSA